MQIEVEFLDEFGRDFVFPVWPGVHAMPQQSKLKPNRLMYSHAFLGNAGIVSLVCRARMLTSPLCQAAVSVTTTRLAM